MSLEVLVTTMKQSDNSLIKKMNLRSDALICNQHDKFSYRELKYLNNKIRYFTFDERGVGLNRNNALLRAKGDICYLADDDLVFKKNYDNLIIDAFKRYSNADILIFNLYENKEKRYIIKKTHKVNYLNFMRFGAARVAFKRKSITKEGISFNLHFGGGAEYSAGEDTLFLKDCLKKNLRILAVPITVAELKDERESTWFSGYDEKFYKDRGALFAAVSRRFSTLLCLQFVIRRHRLNPTYSKVKQFKLLIKGAKEFIK